MTVTVLWVCVDCYLTHHGVREDETPPDREPLSLVDEGAIVTSGGACKCPDGEDPDWACDHVAFSWATCDGCGSTLGGAREALTVQTSTVTIIVCSQCGTGHYRRSALTGAVQCTHCGHAITNPPRRAGTMTTTYTPKADPAPHACWTDPGWDGTMAEAGACAGCDEATAHPCRFCGYGHVFTTHSDLAHAEGGDPQRPAVFTTEPDDVVNAWTDAPHVYAEEV